MFKHYNTSYIDTSLRYLDIFIMMNKSYETTNYDSLVCIFYSVNHWEIVYIRAINEGY